MLCLFRTRWTLHNVTRDFSKRGGRDTSAHAAQLRLSPAAAQEGQGPIPCTTAPRGALDVPVCPTGQHTLPTARVVARDMGKGVGSKISCYSSFLYLAFHQAPEHKWYQIFLFPHCHPSISYPTHSLRHPFSHANFFVINMLQSYNTLDTLLHTHAIKRKKLAGGATQ